MTVIGSSNSIPLTAAYPVRSATKTFDIRLNRNQMDYNFRYIECSGQCQEAFLECSDLLSKNKFYDITIGHIILRSEESLKS